MDIADRATIFLKNRTEAGKKLAEKIYSEFAQSKEQHDFFVLALPRGGVPVAYEIAQKLKAPLDLIITHKLGAPGNEELAIGAIAEDGTIFVDPFFEYQVSEEYLKSEAQNQLKEIKKRVLKYRGGRSLPRLKDKTVILVDDGIATGNTMRAAIRLAQKAQAKKIIVATPVVPPDTLEKLQKEVDAVIYLAVPDTFYAIGQFYAQFEQLDDETVKTYLH